MTKRRELSVREKIGSDLQQMFEMKSRGDAEKVHGRFELDGYSLPAVKRAIAQREGKAIATMYFDIIDIEEGRSTVEQVVDQVIAKAREYRII